MTIRNNIDATLATAGQQYDRTRAALSVANRRRHTAQFTQDAQLIDGARLHIRRVFQQMNAARTEYRKAYRSALAV